MKELKFVILILLYFCFVSCKENRQKEDIKSIVTEWVGKEIKYPAAIRCQSLNQDTTCISFTNSAYKILLYTDSVGCTSCKLKLSEWKQLIAEADSLFPGKADFLLFFQPKEKAVKELFYLFKRDDFSYPVFIDRENKINQLNNFPSQTEFQCYLLDENNKVVLIGNPTLNPKIWEMYKEQITGEKASKPTNTTTAQALNSQNELSDMELGGTYASLFEIENTGNYPLIITDIKTSCGCTIPSWDKQPIPPGKKTKIKVEVKPDAIGFFNKTISVYGNMTSSLKLTIVGTVK